VDQPRVTPLSRLLRAEPVSPRVSPLDLFKLARKKWIAGERIELGKLASELGVGRATVFRWVGSREDLYGEICSAMFLSELERAGGAAKGHGLARMIDIMERMLHALAAATPLRRFVQEDPEFALRVLTSRASQVQYRCTIAVRELIWELVPEPALPADELAYLVVRITESFLYRDVITGDEADIEAAIRAIRLLLSATPEKKSRRRS
jgi:AcrR family transcriptional regulator